MYLVSVSQLSLLSTVLIAGTDSSRSHVLFVNSGWTRNILDAPTARYLPNVMPNVLSFILFFILFRQCYLFIPMCPWCIIFYGQTKCYSMFCRVPKMTIQSDKCVNCCSLNESVSVLTLNVLKLHLFNLKLVHHSFHTVNFLHKKYYGNISLS